MTQLEINEHLDRLRKLSVRYNNMDYNYYVNLYFEYDDRDNEIDKYQYFMASMFSLLCYSIENEEYTFSMLIKKVVEVQTEILKFVLNINKCDTMIDDIMKIDLTLEHYLEEEFKLTNTNKRW